MALTAKQRRFVDEYLVDLNATAAARRAGYSPTSAPRLLATPAVAEAVTEAQATRAARLQLSQDDVVRELAAIAFTDLRDVAEWGNDPDEGEAQRPLLRLRPSSGLDARAAAAIESVKISDRGVAIRLHDKLRALELLGRHLGMFAPRLEVEHTGLDVLFERVWAEAQQRQSGAA